MSKCSKLIGSVVAGIVLVAGVSFADVVSDRKSAYSLYRNKDYVEAQAAFEKVITDYPAAKIDHLFHSQLCVGHCLKNQGKYVEAQAAYEKVFEDYPTASVESFAYAQLYVGDSLRKLKKYVEAQAAYEKILKDYPTASVNVLAIAQDYVGYSLRRQGKQVEATEAYTKAVILYARVPNVASKTLVVVFSRINPALMTTADYTVALQDIIKATSAIEANAEFLGRVKSELEKMK